MNINFDSQEGKKEFKPLDPADFMLGKKIVLSEAITEALENRRFPCSKKELENQNINVKFNENQLYPSLDLVGTFGLNGLSGTAGSIQQFGGGSVRSRFGETMAKVWMTFSPGTLRIGRLVYYSTIQ